MQKPSFRRWAAPTIALAALIGVASSVWLVRRVGDLAARTLEESFRLSNQKLAQFLKLDAEKVLMGKGPDESPDDIRRWLDRFRGIEGLENMFVADDTDTVVASLRPGLERTQDLCAYDARRLGTSDPEEHPGPPGQTVICHKIALTDRHGQAVGSIVLHEPSEALEGPRRKLGRGLVLGIPAATGAMLLLLGTLAALSLRRLRRLEAERERSERLAALGQLSAALAHEIRNPLNAIGLSVEVIGRALRKGGRSDPVVEERLRVVDGELRRLRGLLDDFVETARSPRIHPVRCDLAGTVRGSLDVLREQLAGRGVRVELEVPEAIPARADGERIGQVLRNLILNAMEAMGEVPAPAGGGGQRLRVRARSEDGRVEIEVSDSGPGIPRELIGRIFEPYFTTKKHGLGLGLALSRGFVESHGGSLTVSSRPGAGATFRITLPVEGPEGKEP